MELDLPVFELISNLYWQKQALKQTILQLCEWLKGSGVLYIIILEFEFIYTMGRDVDPKIWFQIRIRIRIHKNDRFRIRIPDSDPDLDSVKILKVQFEKNFFSNKNLNFQVWT